MKIKLGVSNQLSTSHAIPYSMLGYRRIIQSGEPGLHENTVAMDLDKEGLMIVQLRRDLGLSQQQLAVRAKTSSAYISQIERGRKVASRTMLARLAAALNIPLPLFTFLMLDEDDIKKNLDIWKFVSAPLKEALYEALDPARGPGTAHIPEPVATALEARRRRDCRVTVSSKSRRCKPASTDKIAKPVLN